MANMLDPGSIRYETMQDETLQDGTTETEPTAIKKRSVVIAGHRTSISLENVFWISLRHLATQRGISVNQLVSEIDQQRTGNLSSAIRSHVLLDALNRGRPAA